MTAGPEGECLRRATHDRARDRSRMAEPPCGSVHESPVRPLPHAPKGKATKTKFRESGSPQSPFDLNEALKRRGYQWSDGADGRPRSWYIDVDEGNLHDEIAFLKAEIYLREIEPRLQTMTAFTRFSARA
jgi:hypothetical protein